MECRTLIVSALTAKAQGNAAAVTGQAAWRCKRGKCALPVIRMAAGNARTVAERAVSILQEIPFNRMTNEQKHSYCLSIRLSSFVIGNHASCN